MQEEFWKVVCDNTTTYVIAHNEDEALDLVDDQVGFSGEGDEPVVTKLERHELLTITIPDTDADPHGLGVGQHTKTIDEWLRHEREIADIRGIFKISDD